ncbi:hypothetical protein [Streptomyces sp. NPDC048256]|uniref:hypothetical protein n=1 Tax=unclassified Streptomyces TaxID=2593676 RepID=UPI0033C86FA2
MEVIEADAGLSSMCGAVVQDEQQDQSALPVIAGLKAWSLLEEDQQRESFKSW